MVAKKHATGARRRPNLRRRKLVRSQGPLGGFYITRRVPTFKCDSIVAGNMVTTSPTGLLTLGSPQAAQSGGINCYDVPFSMSFQLNQLDTYLDITNICDKYRILSARVKFFTSNVALGAGAGLIMPYIEYVKDSDDNSVPTASTISQKMGVRTVGFNQRGQAAISVRPVPSQQLYVPGGVAYAIPNRSPYVDSNSPDTPHYAIKGIFRSVFLPGGASGAVIGVDVQMTVHAKGLQ